MPDKETNPRLRQAILEVVENQIRDGDPRETSQTVERLEGEGYSLEEARQMVGMVVSVEVFRMLKHQEDFNRERFVRNLERLPEEPWDEDKSAK